MGRPAAGMSGIDEVVQLFLKDAGRVYVHQDANYNVTTLTDITGRVLERYFYSPYGQLEAVIDAHPFDYDGDVEMAIGDCEACEGNYIGDCRRFDADGDRDIDADDLDIVVAFVSGLSGDTRWTRVPSSSRSRLGNPFAHQGLPLDAEIASYQNRARQYNPGLKRFMQRDPLTLAERSGDRSRDAAGLYVFEGSHPLARLDPLGTTQCDPTSTCAQFTTPGNGGAICCPVLDEVGNINYWTTITCDWTGPDGGENPFECISRCVHAHEAVHVADVNCRGCKAYQVGPADSIGPSTDDSECRAAKAGYLCLKTVFGCDSPACLAELEYHLGEQCKAMKTFCPRVGINYNPCNEGS